MAELLTGIPSPLTHDEWIRWAAFFSVRANKEKQAAQKNSRRRR